MKPLLLLAAALGFVTLWSVSTSAEIKPSPDSYYLEQLRREGHSEFCRNVGRPSNRLAAAINEAMTQDPTWAAEAAWFRRIAEAYAKAGCGDV